MPQAQRWVIRGSILTIDRPLVMGILNVTPDSFSDGGRYATFDRAVAHGREMLAEGADLIDVGGESSRPGSAPVPEDEELSRVIPVIERLAAESRVPVSCDTTKYEVARQALAAGAAIVNDISAFRFEPRLADLARETGAGIILMHMQKTPADMQKAPSYQDVVGEVRTFLRERLEYCARSGIPAEQIVLDPGIGFGKRLEDNLALLRELASLAELNRPVMVGASRKAFIGKLLDGAPADQRYEGSLAAAVVALARGARLFRVHDVAGTRRALTVAHSILRHP